MIADLHLINGWIVVFANGLVGLWALAAHSVESLRSRALWVAVGAAQVLLFVQAGLGAARIGQLEDEPDEFHMFYGFLTLIAVAILYGYRSQLARHLHLLYGGGSLFIMGLSIRALIL